MQRVHPGLKLFHCHMVSLPQLLTADVLVVAALQRLMHCIK